MSEYIKIKGVLEGVRDMLAVRDEDISVLKVRMECAKNILSGIITELTPVPGKVEELPPDGPEGSKLGPEAEAAKEDLK